ncbi:hypothetical protein AB1N83_000227 [Pleurotus pulmonarius]
MAHPARVADVGQENIETVHEPKRIQAVDIPCMDRVAVLWRISTARKPSLVLDEHAEWRTPVFFLNHHYPEHQRIETTPPMGWKQFASTAAEWRYFSCPKFHSTYPTYVG